MTLRTTRRVLADALCAAYRQAAPTDHEHHGRCYLGIEGRNGVACQQHQDDAARVWAEMERIHQMLARNGAEAAE
jgi:hypothetical protein